MHADKRSTFVLFFSPRVCAKRQKSLKGLVAKNPAEPARVNYALDNPFHRTTPFIELLHVMVFSTFSPQRFSTAEILQWYRLRWQVELLFKRLKSLAALGHLPKSDDQSARAWVYGKLFVALLTEQVMRQGRTLSPWTAEWRAAGAAQPLAGICICLASASAGGGTSVIFANGYGRLERHRASALRMPTPPSTTDHAIPIYVKLTLMGEITHSLRLGS